MLVFTIKNNFCSGSIYLNICNDSWCGRVRLAYRTLLSYGRHSMFRKLAYLMIPDTLWYSSGVLAITLVLTTHVCRQEEREQPTPHDFAGLHTSAPRHTFNVREIEAQWLRYDQRKCCNSGWFCASNSWNLWLSARGSKLTHQDGHLTKTSANNATFVL